MSRFGRIKTKSVITGPSGNEAEVNADGQLHTVLEGKVDVNNSTTTPLGVGATFTGTATDVSAYAAITLLIHTDEASAVAGVEVQFSEDGIDWHGGEAYTVLANKNKFFTPPVQAKYYRLLYTNGGVEQTVFHVHAMLKKQPVKWSSHNIDDPISDQDDATLTKSVITGKRVDGAYDNLNLTNGNNVKISLEELENIISVNSNSQLKVTQLDSTGREWEMDSLQRAMLIMPTEHHEIHEGDHYYLEEFTTLQNNIELDFCIQTPDTTKQTHITWEYSALAEMELEVFRQGAFAADGTMVVPQNNNHTFSWVGSHTAVASATILTDSTQAWAVDALIGYRVYNLSDGSYGIITDNDATTVTVAALVGGTGNDFQTADLYEINNSSLTIEGGCTISADGFSISRVSSGSSTGAARGIPGGVTRADELNLDRNTKYIFRFTSRANDNILSYKAKWYEHTPG